MASKKPILPMPNTEVLGASGVENYSGLYAERDLNTRLNTVTKRHGTAAKHGQFDAMLATDSILNLGLEASIEPILSANHEVIANGAPDEIVEFVHNAFFNWLGQPYLELPRQAFYLGTWHGFAVFEEQWRTVGDWVLPYKFLARMPWSIWEWNLDENGELESVENLTIKKGAVTIPAESLTVYVHNQLADDFRGDPQARRFFPDWYRKQELLKASLIGHWRNAVGVPVGTYNGEAVPSADDVSAVDETLAGLHVHEQARIVLPAGWEVDYLINDKWAEQAVSIREDIREINLGFLAGFKQMMLAQGTFGSTGSRSSGEVQLEPHYLGAQSKGRQFEAVVAGTPGGPAYTGVMRRLVDFNFPEYNYDGMQPYPYIRISGIRVRTIAEYFKAVESWTKAGMPVYDAMRDAALNILGLDPPEDEDTMEEEAQGEDTQTADEQMPTEAAPPEPPEEEPPPEEPPAEPAAMAAGFSPARELTLAEQSVAFAALNDGLDGGVQEWETRARRVVDGYARSIGEAAMRGRPEMVAALDEMADELKTVAEDIAVTMARFGYNSVQNEMHRQATGESPERSAERVRDQVVQERLAAGLQVALANTGDLDGYADDLTDGLDAASDAAVDAVRGAAQSAVSAAKASRAATTAEALASAIRGIADSTVRVPGMSMTTTAFSIGREEFEREFEGDIAQVQVSEVLDTVTCGPCRSPEHDRRVFKVTDPELDQHRPPYAQCEGGAKCRGILVYKFERVTR